MNAMPPNDRATARRAVVMLGLVVPTAITWLYFIRLGDAAPPWPQAAFAGGKLLQFALPITWILLGGGGLWPRNRPRRGELVEGALLGAAISAAGIVATFAWLVPSGALQPLIETSLERRAAFGIDAPLAFAAFGLFYALIHSGLEEWYWRGFVQSGLDEGLPRPWAMAIAAIAFAAHHLLLLATFFGGLTPLALLLAACVAFGGWLWSAMRMRHGHLYGAWLSHGAVDAAIFVAGWLLAGGG